MTMRTAAAILTLLLCLTSSLGAQERAPDAGKEETGPRITLERALIERGGLLLRPGQLEIEPAVEYTYFSSRRIAVSGFSILPTLIVGVLETEKVERNVVDTVLTARLGVFKDFQVEVRVPYRFVSDRRSTETTETTASNDGIGDVEGALFYQPLRERGPLPDLIAGVRGKALTADDPFGRNANQPPLGTGFYAVVGSLTAVKSLDPAALFASVLYAHNFSRTVRLLEADPFKTEIEPGDSFGYNLGLALAITPELAASLRFEHRIIESTRTRQRVAGGQRREVPGSALNVGTAFAGVNWSPARNVGLDLSVGIGATTDAPDLTIRFAIPIRFTLW